MFLRFNTRKKDGKIHRYWSVVENRRLHAGHTTQRTVLYLGEINDPQQAAWRKQLDVLNEATQRTEQICLFPEDRDIPPEVLNGLQVKLLDSKMSLVFHCLPAPGPPIGDFPAEAPSATTPAVADVFSKKKRSQVIAAVRSTGNRASELRPSPKVFDALLGSLHGPLESQLSRRAANC